MTPDSIQRRIPDVGRLIPRMQKIAAEHPTPLYVYDAAEARKNFRSLKKAFEAAGVPIDLFFAVKSNPYSGLLKTVVAEGGGLDVSSRRELRLALAADAPRIIYTGPAKTAEDFRLICAHADRITVNLESVRELRLLSTEAVRAGTTVRCGLRISTGQHPGWTKFGLPLASLPSFLREGRKLPGVQCVGIHFHVSWNKDAIRYCKTLGEIARVLKNDCSPEERNALEYLDIGGGFFPEQFEGIHAWNPQGETHFISEDLDLGPILEQNLQPRYILEKTIPITLMAAQIADCLKREIFPLLSRVRICAEPGRFISYSAMHMLLTLVDRKSERIGIADGGINMVGWDKYECYQYAPLFNCTHVSLDREVSFLLFGSLCTPDDVWGYALRCSDIREGDLILLPFQGAYTFGLAQEFIRDIPPVVDLPVDHE